MKKPKPHKKRELKVGERVRLTHKYKDWQDRELLIFAGYVRDGMMNSPKMKVTNVNKKVTALIQWGVKPYYK